MNYDETYFVPNGTNSATISYINNAGYQIYLNILVFANGTNYYYDPKINPYINYILETTNMSVFPAVSQTENSFDFYRLRIFDQINPYTGITKSQELASFINDNITLFNYNLKYYNDHSLLLDFDTDTTLIYNDGTNIVSRDTADFFYDESDRILEYLNEHIMTKYIDILPLTSTGNNVTTIGSSFHPMSNKIPNVGITSSDIIAYAFSIKDNSPNEIGVGLGIDGYFSNNSSIQMYKLGNEQFVRISDDGINYDKIAYSQNPMYGADDIYYVFQDNTAQTFTVYENKNDIPLIVINASDSTKYANLVNMLSNNANLLVFGKTTIRYYTEQYAYTQASDLVKTLMKNATQWFYIGGEDPAISTFGLPTLRINHTTYLDESNTIKRLDTKPFYIDLLNKAIRALDPNFYNNVYNLDGIHGVAKNSIGETKNIAYNTAIYGVLDSIYNNHLTGNQDTVFKTLQADIPLNKMSTNFITNADNPFSSYALYDSFMAVSSNVNYDTYLMRNEQQKLQASNLLTYDGLKKISDIFDDTIHHAGDTVLALEDLKYIKEPSFMNSQLFPIVTSGTNTSQTNVILTDKYDHIFSTSNTSITGIPISNSQFYGFSFTITSIKNDGENIEIGVVLNGDPSNKIVIRKTGDKYDLLLQYTPFPTSPNSQIYQQSFSFNKNPSFSSGSTYTFFLFNNNVPLTTINTINAGITDPAQQTSQSSIQVYENFTLLLNQHIDNLSPYSNLLNGAGNINLFVRGNVALTFYAKSYALQKK